MVLTTFHRPVIQRPHGFDLTGVQRIYRFPNGYGASVVRFRYSYGYAEGLWELAVVTFPGESNEDFGLAYDTEITDDVIGHLDPDQVHELLEQIAALPARGNAT